MSRECRKRTRRFKMRLQSSVFFDIYADLFYLKTVPYGPYMELTAHQKRDTIHTLTDDGKITPVSEILEFVRNFCEHFVADTKNQFYLDKLTYSFKIYRKVKVTDTDDKIYFRSYDFTGGNSGFILTTNNDLIYPCDIKKALQAPFYFKNIKSESRLNPNNPIYIQKYDKHTATVRPLTQQDTVVDTQLNQIWPNKTDCPPLALKKLLEQTTEKIY